VPAPGQSEITPEIITEPVSDIVYDDALDVFGEEGFNAVAGALEMFRRR